jgi:hypothetical protein
VSLAEISGLMIAVLEQAGFDTKGVRSLDLGSLSTATNQLYLDRSFPERENLKMLKTRVVSDLEAERKELFRLQCALVGRIAAARRDRLAATPLGHDESPLPDKTDPGVRMLTTILAQLKEEMKLLPETVANIRQAGTGLRGPAK